MICAEQHLHCHSFAQQSGRNIGRDNAAADIGVLVRVVKTCQSDRMGQLPGVFIQILLREMGYIIAGTYKGQSDNESRARLISPA